MPLHGLIPAVMLGMGFVSIITALIGRARICGAALLALLGLFVLSFWFPEPVTEENRGLHWFPVSLLILFLAIPLMFAAAAVGALFRFLLRLVRRAPVPEHGTR
jgi:hypothetical protein